MIVTLDVECMRDHTAQPLIQKLCAETGLQPSQFLLNFSTFRTRMRRPSSVSIRLQPTTRGLEDGKVGQFAAEVEQDLVAQTALLAEKARQVAVREDSTSDR